MTTLSIERLVKEFGTARAVDGVSLRVADGEMIVLVGPSGCGKTTCLRCIAGLERPTAGEIRIGDRVVSSPAQNTFVPPEKREIGMVFQSYAIWPHMTVFNNVAYPLRAIGVPRADIQPRVEKALQLVRLAHLAERFSSQISGGQQQRVALARSLVAEPKLLLFDEPLSNLDAGLRLQMRIEIKELQNRLGFTAVYVTHDQSEAMAIADRIAIMDRGVLQQVGSARDIYDRPANAFVAGFMGTTNLLNGKVSAQSNGQLRIALDGNLTVLSAADGSVKEGETVKVSIRPEALEIRPAGEAQRRPNAWPAKVTLSTFLGDQIVYRAQMGPHQIEVHTRPGEIFQVGDPVLLETAPERCVIVKN